MGQLILAPAIIHRIGLAAFGVYSLLLIIISILVSLDGGVGASLIRFFSRALHSPDARRASDVTALASTALLFFVGLGGVLGLAGWLMGDLTHRLLHLKDAMVATEDTGQVVWLLAVALTLALVGTVPNALLQANNDYLSIALAAVAAQAAYLASALLVGLDRGVLGLLHSLLLLYATRLLLSTIRAVTTVPLSAPRLMSLSEVGEVVSFAGRTQLSMAAGLINSQTDALVIAAFLPSSALGLYSVAANFAQLLRQVPSFALGPLYAQLNSVAFQEGRDAVLARAMRLQRLWGDLVTGWTLNGAIAAAIGVVAWLGTDYTRASVVVVCLALGNGVNLLTGVLSTLARTLNKPGQEARYGLLATLANAVVTLALVQPLGLVGVVLGTALSPVLAAGYFLSSMRRATGERLPGLTSGIPLVRTALSLALTAAGCSAMYVVSDILTGTGLAALVLVGAGATPGMLLYYRAQLRLAGETLGVSRLSLRKVG